VWESNGKEFSYHCSSYFLHRQIDGRRKRERKRERKIERKRERK
jgi:hypothetical protein